MILSTRVTVSQQGARAFLIPNRGARLDLCLDCVTMFVLTHLYSFVLLTGSVINEANMYACIHDCVGLTDETKGKERFICQ